MIKILTAKREDFWGIVELLSSNEPQASYRVRSLQKVVMPSIKNDRAIVSFDEKGKITGFANWTLMTPDRSIGFLSRKKLLTPEDFTTTEGNFWCVDMVTTKGFMETRAFVKELRKIANDVGFDGEYGFFNRITKNRIGWVKR